MLVSFSGPGAALGHVAIFDTFSDPGEARVPASLSVPRAAVGLVTVSGPGAACAC